MGMFKSRDRQCGSQILCVSGDAVWKMCGAMGRWGDGAKGLFKGEIRFRGPRPVRKSKRKVSRSRGRMTRDEQERRATSDE